MNPILTLVGVQILVFHLIVFGVSVGKISVPGERRIGLGAKIGIVLDYVSSLINALHIFSLLDQFPQI